MLSSNPACRESLDGPNSVACDDANVHALEKLGNLGPASCALRGFLLEAHLNIFGPNPRHSNSNLLPTTLFDLVQHRHS
jgi:hypothetical protein